MWEHTFTAAGLTAWTVVSMLAGFVLGKFLERRLFPNHLELTEKELRERRVHSFQLLLLVVYLVMNATEPIIGYQIHVVFHIFMLISGSAALGLSRQVEKFIEAWRGNK
jgi:hypothetical protein